MKQFFPLAGAILLLLAGPLLAQRNAPVPDPDPELERKTFQVAEGLEVPAIADRLAELTHEDYEAEGFSADVIAGAEDRTEYESEAAGLFRAHTHS